MLKSPPACQYVRLEVEPETERMRSLCSNLYSRLLASRLLLRIRQLPGEGKDIPSYGLQNVRIDRVGAIGGLMKVWVDTTADDGDGWDSRLLEGHVIAAGKNPYRSSLSAKPAVRPAS